MSQTLTQYFADTFLPKRLAGQKPDTIKNYRSALAGLRTFLQREALLSEQTDELLKDYRKWGFKYQGWAETTCRHYTVYVRAIAAHHDPVKFPVLQKSKAGPGTGELWDLLTQYGKVRLRGASPSSVNQYHCTLRNFDRVLGHPATLPDLTEEHITDAMWWLVERGRSRATANTLRRGLVALWNYAARQRIVERFPEISKIVEPERAPIAWSQEQLAALFGACQAQKGTIAGIPAALWWTALHAVAWDTGERIAAMLSLAWVDWNPATRWLIARAETRKWKRKDKSWRLHPDTAAAIELIRDPARELIFPWPHRYDYLFQKYETLLKSAGLPFDRKHKFHCIRRSVASWFEAAGGNATKLLGHSSRRTTEAYLDPSIVVDEQASDVLFRPGDGGDAP